MLVEIWQNLLVFERHGEKVPANALIDNMGSKRRSHNDRMYRFFTDVLKNRVFGRGLLSRVMLVHCSDEMVLYLYRVWD